jgi:acetylornithine/succinyldiaminopimelate/putrescine aminotransferase
MSGLDRAFFCNSGTEAIVGALKMVHSHGRALDPEKYEIISLDNSCHGRSMGALSVTGQAKYRADFEPLIPGVKFVPPNDVAALEAAFSPRTAGVILELIQGEGGIYPLTPEFAGKARELADRYDALLLADETQCGVGRPGVYFAYQRSEPVIMPDVVVAAKPVACGLPLGFILANEKAAAAIRPGMHGTTFGGGPLTCRVGLEFVAILDELLPSIRRMGAYFLERLQHLAAKHAVIKEVRGFGLMLGVELHVPGKQLVLDGIGRGLLFNCTHENVLRFLPPYIVTEKEVDRAIRILDRLIAKA